MKKIFKLTLLFLLLAAYSSFAQRKKIMAAHPDIIQIMAEVKKSGENTAMIIKGWTSAKGVEEGRKQYENLLKMEAGFMARYKVIIQTPKILKKTGENIKDGLNQLVDANNKFLKFCDEKTPEYSTKSNAAGVGDVVDGIASVLLKIIQFYKDATQVEKDQFKKEVDQQALVDWKAIK